VQRGLTKRSLEGLRVAEESGSSATRRDKEEESETGGLGASGGGIAPRPHRK
jgi:hypothetical protein